MKVSFDQLPPESQAWVFGAGSDLTTEQETQLQEEVTRYVDNWAAHGAPVSAAAEIRDHRFLVVGARSGDPSGCSIDKLFKVLQEFQRRTGVDLLDSSLLFYRGADGRVNSTSRGDFRQLVSSGTVKAATPVFDGSVSSIGELAAWEKSASELFPRAEYTAE